MILEFFVSILISFGISISIGLSFKVVQKIVTMNKIDKDNTKKSKTDEILKEHEKNQEILIDFINKKISHELSISTSIKITSSSFLGFSAIVFALILTTGIQDMFEILKMRGADIVYGASFIVWAIPLVTMLSGLALIVLPMIITFFKIIPKYKKEDVSIRKFVNEFHSKSKDVILTKVESMTLDDLENVEEYNHHSSDELKLVLIIFGVGLGLIFITFLFGEGTLIDNWIGEYPQTENN